MSKSKIVTIEKFLKAGKYLVDGEATGKFCWNCFGKNSRFLGVACEGKKYNKIGADIIFDTKTHVVYVCELYLDTKKGFQKYHWINPKWEAKYAKEGEKRGFPVDNPFDGYKITRVTAAEILALITKYVK